MWLPYKALAFPGFGSRDGTPLRKKERGLVHPKQERCILRLILLLYLSIFYFA